RASRDPGPAGASLGRPNINAALQKYGAYVVDQGASMGIDADSNRSDLWSQSGLLGAGKLPVHASDWRARDVSGTPSPLPVPDPVPLPAPTPAPSGGSGSTGT